ncbi:hypothetical protein CcI49_03130 [Frankia sp. CcI49]|uniref:hypothetical protein n=1 Tax=unclassified Frankia TaxID=2632575 RepID=UPI0006C9E96D|nr:MULTISPECIES: hypothetical protein [unclassified Frankia]KPM55705.1 hypothetical protein ACG83_10505 [Frankia sp. R43]ONH62386.1 hypothetical protein CcI49_03130 [Frankia sp. CcI49]
MIADGVASALANGSLSADPARAGLAGYALLRLSLVAHRLRDGGDLLTPYDATRASVPDRDDRPSLTSGRLELAANTAEPAWPTF